MTIAFNHLGKLGQLGNQMFQYAATKGIASKLGVPFMIPNHREVFDDGIGNKYTILLFDVFKLHSPKRAFNYPYNLSAVPTTLLGTLKTDNYIREESFHFDEEFFNLDKSKNYSLHGFFQTEKYFKHIEDEIQKDFAFKDEITNECRLIIQNFKDPIALHIRRGDFVINSGNHPPLDMDYYKSALELFEPDREVIIFSDDTEWCKEQELFESDRFAIAEGGNQFYDLCLMTMCHDFIIANSSFSWWGAWLARIYKTPTRGRVIAPKKWFGENLDHDTTDLYCEGWTIL